MAAHAITTTFTHNIFCCIHVLVHVCKEAIVHYSPISLGPRLHPPLYWDRVWHNCAQQLVSTSQIERANQITVFRGPPTHLPETVP